MEANSPTRASSRPARRAGLFWKLLASAGAISLALVALLCWVFSNAYESLLDRQVDERLETQAAALAELLAEDWPNERSEQLQSRIRRLGREIGMRVTLMNASGEVLADSAQENLAAVEKLENHRNRSEFAAAIRNGRGAARRLSPSVGKRFQYRAVRVGSKAEPLGVVRAAVETAPLNAQVEGLVRWAWAIGLLATLAALGVSYWLAARLTDPLVDVAETAKSLAAGDRDRRPPLAIRADDEIGVMAGALNEIGRRLAQRERQLTSTSQTQSTVLEAMTESVIAVDSSERVLFANASAGRVFGFNAKNVENLSLLEAVRSHELRAVMQKALRSRQLCNAELTWRGKALRVFDALASPLPGDPPPGVVIVLRDVSELKRLEQMRQQFIANVSHELKTPLSSIKAYTETLLSGARNDPVHCERFLNRIDEQAGHLHQLILDMLSLARIESSQSPIELTSVSLGDIVRRCLADYERQAAAREVKLESTAAGGIKVRADEEGLRQILSNLIDNGIKYTPSGGRVTVSARTENGSAVIEVADTGVGILPEHHDRLFERFYRVDKARSRELGGTGLGLSIVKHLCQSMGGSVTVASQVGSGSVFTVKLPLAAG